MLQLETKAWSVRDMMRFAIDLLAKSGIDEPRLAVDLLLSHALKCQRIELYAASQRPLQKREIRDFRLLLERRLNREPVQYIVGSANFMGLLLRVDPRVFIPRPETETLVEQVILHCRDLPAGRVTTILDIGTGSGNIPIALAKFVREARITTVDASADALEVARLNAKVHAVEEQIDFHHVDVFEPIDQLLRQRWDVLVSNPPYVSRDEWELLPQEIRRFEPRIATSDWGDGLAVHRRLAELAPYVLKDRGRIFVEIGVGQSLAVKALMLAAGMEEVHTIRDLDGNERVIVARTGGRMRNTTNVN